MAVKTPETHTALVRRARKINRVLAETYPEAHCELDFQDAFQLLVSTVLSAQTTDKRVNMTTPALFAKYPTPEDLAAANPEDVAEILKPTGFFNAKTKSVMGLSAALTERFGGIDVLVNNAGYGYRAAVEEGDDAQVRALFDTHFFGTVAVIKAVLPGMRARRSGAIVNISSIGATVTPVGSGYYAAAKAAIEGMSGALRGELAPLGISVTTVEPGAFRTDFAGRSLVQSATLIDDYAATAGKRRKENDTMHGNQAGDPAKAAHAIITAVESSQPPAFLLLGPDALALYRYTVDTRSVEVADWEELTSNTNFDA